MLVTGHVLRYAALLVLSLEVISGIVSARTAGAAASAFGALGGEALAGAASTGVSAWVYAGAVALAVFHGAVLFALGEILIWMASQSRP